MGQKQFLYLIMAIAVILHAIGANNELWFDEIASVQNSVRLPIGTLLRTYGSANNHVLNSVLAHFSVGIFGSEEPWVVRLPSILFGIGGVWAFHFVARQLWTAPTALMGTFMYAMSYHQVYYAQQSRGYSAMLFFALMATGLLLRMELTSSRRNNLRDGLGYASAIGLGTYSLLLMTFVILGHAAVLLFAKCWKLLNWLLAGSLIALMLYAPILGDTIAYYAQHTSYTGVPLFSSSFLVEIRPILIVLILAAIVLPVAVLRLWRKFPFATAILISPAIFNIVIPVLRGQGVHPRSFIYGLPIAYLLLTELLDWARQYFRWSPALGASMVAAVSLWALLPYYSTPKQGFRQALDYVAVNQAPNDKMIGLSYGGKAVRFYNSSVVLIENYDQLQEWLKTARDNTWVLYSFQSEMRSSMPDLYNWVINSTVEKKRFPSVIGDGSVYVRLWMPGTEVHERQNG